MEKAPFLITTYYPNNQSFIFACGSPGAVGFFLRHMPQPLDFTMVSVAELQANGSYEKRLLDLFLELPKLKAGDKVAWKMADGNTMAGEIMFEGFSTYIIRRVDGSQCEVAKDKCHLATSDEVLAACEFFQTLGK